MSKLVNFVAAIGMAINWGLFYSHPMGVVLAGAVFSTCAFAYWMPICLIEHWKEAPPTPTNPASDK